MKPIEGSETSAFKTQTPGKYPKENIIQYKPVFASKFVLYEANTDLFVSESELQRCNDRIYVFMLWHILMHKPQQYTDFLLFLSLTSHWSGILGWV
jgi:hypothetical protein